MQARPSAGDSPNSINRPPQPELLGYHAHLYTQHPAIAPRPTSNQRCRTYPPTWHMMAPRKALFVNLGGTPNLSLSRRYRGLPTSAATTIAFALSACAAASFGTMAGYVVGLLFVRPDDPFGVTGIPALLAALNVAVPVFIGTFAAMISWHHQSSWRAPTFAFVVCIILIRVFFGPFDISFSPFMLTTGTLVWLISCWLVRKKGARPPKHVL